jgi:hypothetical protein
MTRAVFVVTALAYGILGCSVEDKFASDDGSDDNAESDGTGPDYSNDEDGEDDNNSGGSDEDDAGADALPVYPTQHPRIFIAANKARLQASLNANTQPATRFRNVVDRWMAGQSVYGFEVWNAALLGALTGDARYCAKAISTIDAYVAAEEAKIAAGAQPIVAQNSYLHVGEIIGNVVLTYDWCFDTVTSAQKSRWLAYANQAVWNVWNHTQAKWGSRPLPWSGWAVNDAGNNYYYSFLRATMLLGLATKGEHPQGDAWITQFRDTKVLGQLVPTFDAELRGGGSREGTAYGTAMRSLFHMYDLWHATTGEKLQAKTKHARQSMRAFMHQVVPTLDRFAPTGDQPRDMTATLFDYQRHYLQQLIALYPNDPIAPRAKALLDSSSLPVMARAELMVYDFLYDNASVTAQPLDGLGTSYHASGIGHVFARSGWDRQATWINFIAGPYTQQHAHQDQGSLLIYKEGWLASDAVIQSANGIIQETGSHTMVRINSNGAPVKQKWDTESELVALHQGDGWLHAAADVTAAYGGNAAVGRVQREIVFIKPNVVVVYDRVTTPSGTTQVWQMPTPTQPTLSGATATISGTHTMRVQRMVPASATTTVTNLASVTGYRAGYRVDTTLPGGDNRFLHVFSIDGAVSSAAAPNDATVTLSMANGQTVTVAFVRDNIGATLTYGGTTKSLTAGVDSVPE